MVRGIVKFFKADKGWGAIASDQTPGEADVWVHFSAIDMPGNRALEAGDVVEFEYEQRRQDGFRMCATTARKLGSGPAPTLRRVGDQVVMAPSDTPDTPLTPKRNRRSRI